MRYINVHGPENRLMETLGVIARCGCFAPEEGEAIRAAIRFDTNRYEPLLTKAKGLLKDLEEPTLAGEFDGPVDTYDIETVADYLEKFAGEVASINKRRTFLENELALYSKTEELVRHMEDLDVSFHDLLKVHSRKIRVGRLP